MRLVVAALLGMLVPVLAHGQKKEMAKPAPATALRFLASTETQFPGSTFGHVTCDEGGNVYARKYDGTDDSVLHAPVRRIGADGRVTQSFGVADASPDLVQGFFVASDGKVSLVAWAGARVHSGNRAYVMEFEANGSPKSTIQVDTEEWFLPAHIAVFKSGEFLLSGRRGSRPFTGVFTPDGKLISTIFEPEDEELQKRAEAGDPDVQVTESNSSNDAVDLGGVAVGSDGNAYLMRRTSPALIYVISARGEVIRKLRINADESLRWFPEQLQSFPGGLVVLFDNRAGDTRVLKAVDLQGNPIASYGIGGDPRVGVLACYAPPTFTFLDTTETDGHGYMSLSKLEPK